MPAAAGGKSKSTDTQQPSASKKGRTSADHGSDNLAAGNSQNIAAMANEPVPTQVASSSVNGVLAASATSPDNSPSRKRTKLSASQLKKVIRDNKSATLSTNREYWSVSGPFFLTSVKFLTEQQTATLLTDENLKNIIGISPFTPSIVNGTQVQENTVAAYRNFTKEQVT